MQEEIVTVTMEVTAGQSLCSGRRYQVRRIVAASRIGSGRLDWD
jgi:hypothetical protein